MEHNSEDIATLCLRDGENICSAGHYPLLVGYTVDGEPLYMLELPHIPIPENARPGYVKIKEHYAYPKGSTYIRTIEGFLVLVLRYDPESYNLCKQYSPQAKEAIGMDATGPFSWKFHRKLQDIEAREENRRFCGDKVIWSEVLVQPVEAENIPDDCDFASADADADSEKDMALR